MVKVKKLNYFYAVGRRREASARVRVHKGEGQITVNDKPFGQYFAGDVNAALLKQPFDLTETGSKYYATVKVEGGGLNGQLDATILGIARALIKVNEKYRPALKKAGLLTRDERTRERRKVGMGGKARRKRQSPKR